MVLPLLGNYAKVELVTGVGDTIATMMGTLASAPIDGPGLTQEDAVQLASLWAWRRDRFMRGASWEVKVSLSGKMKGSKTDAFHGVWQGSAAELAKLLTANPELRATLMVGDGPLSSPYPGGGKLGDDWGITLARALDRQTVKIAKARQGGVIPTGYASWTKSVAAPAVVGIIVGGAALAVVGSVAVWRYFDPELRKATAVLNAASSAYDARVQVAKQTGKMPPPSLIEEQTQGMISDLSREERNRSLLIGLGIAGGLVGGAVAIAAIRAA